MFKSSVASLEPNLAPLHQWGLFCARAKSMLLPAEHDFCVPRHICPTAIAPGILLFLNTLLHLHVYGQFFITALKGTTRTAQRNCRVFYNLFHRDIELWDPASLFCQCLMCDSFVLLSFYCTLSMVEVKVRLLSCPA